MKTEERPQFKATIREDKTNHRNENNLYSKGQTENSRKEMQEGQEEITNRNKPYRKEKQKGQQEEQTAGHDRKKGYTVRKGRKGKKKGNID
jgi:hypothetical protein